MCIGKMIRWLIRIASENLKAFRQTNCLARMELKKTHMLSDFGWFWAIAKPLMYILMFYFALSTGFRTGKDIEGTVCPYFIWLASGIVPWQFISDLLTTGANCFVKRRALICKYDYPVTTIPMISVISKLYIHLIMLGVLIFLALMLGVRPSIYWLQLPIYMFLTIAFIYVWSFLTGLVNIMSTDVLELIKSVKPAFFWLSGILFNIRGRTNPFFTYNPISFIAEGYRNVFAYNVWIWEERSLLTHFLIVMLILTAFTYILFRKLEKSLPELL